MAQRYLFGIKNKKNGGHPSKYVKFNCNRNRGQNAIITNQLHEIKWN